MIKKTLSILFAALFTTGNLMAQDAILTYRQDTLTFHLNRISGIGPSGFSTVGIQPIQKKSDFPFYNAYPVLANIPPEMDSVRFYYYAVDPFQQAYQAYSAGVVSRQYFLDRADVYGWRLDDTTHLSKSPLKCGIAIVTGVNKEGKQVYVVDANNNGDLSDDTIKVLSKQLFNPDMLIQNSTAVNISYRAGNIVKMTKILVDVNIGYNTQAHELSLSFPQYLYAKINYSGQPYILVSNGFQLSRFICFLPDMPYFTQVNAANRVTVNKLFHVGNASFQLTEFNEFTGDITITGSDVRNFQKSESFLQSAPKIKRASKKESAASLGFLAPPISGKMINTIRKGAMISTRNMHGKYVFVDFWATYCGPCIAELPYLREAYRQFGPTKLEILGILDENNKIVADKLLTDNRVSWPNIILKLPTTDITGYGPVTSFPHNFLIAPSGEIVAVDLRGDQLAATITTLMNSRH